MQIVSARLYILIANSFSISYATGNAETYKYSGTPPYDHPVSYLTIREFVELHRMLELHESNDAGENPRRQVEID